MLNIEKRISLSKKSKRLIKALVRKKKGLNSDSWDDINKFVKNEISKKTLYNQGPKCVYCERYFIAERNEIEHFAHKGEYSQYTFITTNLFYACNYCNTVIKNQRNIIYGPKHRNYKKNFFSILHPYFHNPDKEIYYREDKIYLDWNKCSDLGKFTIKFWKWDETMMTMLRSRTLKNERENPLTTLEEKILIQQIIAYKQ